MKTSDEMVNDLLKRRDEYNAKKKSRRSVFKKAALIASGAVIVALAAFGAMKLFGNEGKRDIPLPDIPAETPAAEVSEETVPAKTAETEKPDANEISYPATVAEVVDNSVDQTANVFLTWWNDKTVTKPLFDALESGEQNVFSIAANPYFDYKFEYKGKTLAEYYKDMCNEKLKSEKLRTLLKDGEYLKYGEKLYNEGAPDGEKWAESLYKERVGYYGDELLKEYIVDGTFLSEKAKTDSGRAEIARKENEEAVNAYLSDLAGRFDLATEIRGYRIVFVSITREEFEKLDCEEIDAWTFSPAYESVVASDNAVRN